MNKTTFVVATLIALGLQTLSFAQIAQNPWGNQQVSPWKVDFGVSIVDRQGTKDNRSVVESAGGGRTHIFGNDLGVPDTGAGPDLRIEYAPGTSLTSYELRGRFFSFSNADSARGGLTMLSTGPIIFNNIDTLHDSSYFSLEFNGKRKMFQGFDLVAGARFNQFQETVLINGSGNTPQPVPFPNADFAHEQSAKTSNPHIGLQIGADWEVNLGYGMTLETVMRLGGYANFAKQTTRRFNNLLNIDSQSAISRDDFLFSGEIGMRLNFNILDDKLSGFIGGEYHHTDEMLTASNQAIDPTNATISGNKGLRMSGFVFGLTSRF